MSNGSESMSPEEFAKLMGAYPEPAHNPLPAYGGYMDNSPANFAWVNNNAYFGAEEGDWIYHDSASPSQKDAHIASMEMWATVLEDDPNDEEAKEQFAYWHEVVYKNRATPYNPDYDAEDDETFVCVKSGKTEHMDNGFLVPNVGMVSEEHMTDDDWNAWHRHNSYANPDSYSKEQLEKMGWFKDVMGEDPDGDYGERMGVSEDSMIQPFEAFQGNPQFEEKNYYGADDGKIPLNISIDTSGSTSAGFMGGDINASYRKLAIDSINDLKPPHVVILDHNRTVETVYEGDAQGAIQFINDERNLQPRNGTASMGSIVEAISTLHGHKMILTDGDWVSVKSAIRMAEDEKKNCGCGQDPCITYGAETFEAPYGGTGALMDIGKETPLADFTGKELAESSAIHGDFDQASLNYSGHQNLEVRAEDEMTRMQVSIGCPSGSTKDFTKIFDVNVRDIGGSQDMPYLTSELEDAIRSRVASWNETYEADMEVVTDGMAVISNKDNETVGAVEVVDDADDDEMVELSIQDENFDEIGSFTLDDGVITDDFDDYLAESKTPSLLTLGIGAVAVILGWDVLKGGVNKVFNNETQEMLENDPELIENPDTGDLDPAAYEELVVESTGYALDIIPQGLDGSFMGSRFAALPTERYVDYNDPGIGAHTDVAMNRDELFLEPEMAMVQASENVKESEAPGQSPYNSITGEENPDFNYRVIKETHPISLDPAVKPFIPQSMAGYTGNANTPPSVMNKMFNIGVLGQTPAFVAGEGDIGANHFGSRDAIPNTLGLNGAVGGPLSDQVNASYTDGNTSMSLAQWAIENTVSQTSDTEAVVIDRSSGAMKRVRRV